MSKNRRKRYFIVAPTLAGADAGDTLHQVCSTTSRKSFFEIYQYDLFEEVAAYGNLGGAVARCRRGGYHRPFVLA